MLDSSSHFLFFSHIFEKFCIISQKFESNCELAYLKKEKKCEDIISKSYKIKSFLIKKSDSRADHAETSRCNFNSMNIVIQKSCLLPIVMTCLKMGVKAYCFFWERKSIGFGFSSSMTPLQQRSCNNGSWHLYGMEEGANRQLVWGVNYSGCRGKCVSGTLDIHNIIKCKLII